MGEGEAGEPVQLSPDDAFAVLGDETRLGILQALWEAHDPHADDDAVPFSELYERVGHDDTGNFNYHLGQLTDHFVTQTATGYTLTGSGFEVVRAVLAGTVSERPRIDPIAIDSRCPRCGGQIQIYYVNQRTMARCIECAGLFGSDRADGDYDCLFHLPFPPAGWEDRTPEEVFHATIRYNFHKIAAYRDGVCPYCGGVVDETIDVCEDHETSERDLCPRCDRYHLVEVREMCRRCKSSEWGPLTIAILTHPAVTAFYKEHGIEHRFASWESCLRGGTATDEILETDPLRIRVTIPCEDEKLHLTLDRELTVHKTVRETSFDG